MNDQIKFYNKTNIAFGECDKTSLKTNVERRRKLYRNLGLPAVAFRGSNILEVGAGSGFASLVFFEFMNVAIFGGGYLDALEPTHSGAMACKKRFEDNNIPKNLYTVHETAVEDFSSEKLYDIIICEGFLPCVDNKKEIIEKLKSLSKSKGVIVITCSDEVGFFVESMKRLVYSFIIRDIENYDDKVAFLTKIISEQLKNLRGASRPPEEYAREMMLEDMSANGNFLSIEDAIDYFGDDFYILGTSSPKMFTDYSFFKDIWYDTKSDIKEQFKTKRLSLLMANMPEVIVSKDISEILVNKISEVVHLSYKYEKTFNNDILINISDELNHISKHIGVMPECFLQVFKEIQLAVKDMMANSVDLAKYEHFNAAFGRSQQYIAFEKV